VWCLRRTVCVLVIALVAQLASPLSIAAETTDQRALLTLKVNTVERGDVYVVLRGSDALADLSDLRSGGIKLAGVETEHLYGADYVDLKQLGPSVQYQVDAVALELRLTVPPAMLDSSTNVNLASAALTVKSSSQPAAFFNYSVSDGSLGPSFAGELGASIRNRYLTAFVSRSQNGSLIGPITLTGSNPGAATRVDVGDLLASTGTLGGTTMLAGIDIARDFSMNPSILRTSSSSIAGQVNTPTTADIYVNGHLVAQQQLAPGSFSLNNIPVQAGANNEEIVLRDAFGNTRVISGSFYFNTNILAKGLSDYDVALGVPTSAADETSFTVGSIGGQQQTPFEGHAPVLMGRYSRGLTNSLTAGVRVEHQQTLSSVGFGLGASTRLGAIGFSGAISKDGTQGGAAADLSYQYVGRRFSVGFDQQVQSPWYATISQPASFDRQLSSTYVTISRIISRTTSFLGTYTAQHWRDQSPEVTVTAGILQRIGRLGSLSFSVGRQTLQGQRGPVVDLSFITGLGLESTLSVVHDSETGQGSSTTLGLSRTPTGLNGLDYDLDAGRSNGKTVINGTGTYRAKYGLAQLQATQGGGSQFDQFTYAGSIAMAGGAVGIGQPVDGAFAVVDTGISGVPVTVNGRLVGRTNRSGKIVAFGLVPYLPNQISIDPNSLPEDVIVDSPSVTIVPVQDSGRTVRFPLHRFQAFTGKISVLTPKGLKLPAYGQFVVHVAGKDFTSDIGEDGAFFLENVPAGTYPAEIAYKGGDCRFKVIMPASRATFTKLGTLQCVQK